MARIVVRHLYEIDSSSFTSSLTSSSEGKGILYAAISSSLNTPPFFRQKIAFSEKIFLIFCSKRPLFLCLAVFFSLLVFFFCSDDVC